jgi:hypothetical protein
MVTMSSVALMCDLMLQSLQLLTLRGTLNHGQLRALEDARVAYEYFCSA